MAGPDSYAPSFRPTGRWPDLSDIPRALARLHGANMNWPSRCNNTGRVSRQRGNPRAMAFVSLGGEARQSSVAILPSRLPADFILARSLLPVD